MNGQTLKTEVKENSISKTGYRALFLLKLLIEAPRTRDEILEIFSKDPIIAKGLSKDTITNTVNALRTAGCGISKPNMRTDFRYVIRNHPFSTKITDAQISYLQELRKSIISYNDWQLIESVNQFYEKISEFLKDEKSKEELLYNHPFKNIDKKVLYDLVRYANTKKSVNILYNSPRNGIENLEFIPDFVQFENEKLYVWGYVYKYKNLGYLRVDKIKSVDVIDFFDNSQTLEEYFKKIVKVRYKLSGYSAHLFSENDSQKIIDVINDELIIESSVYSEFNFTQKILSYGTDCVIIEPEEFKQKFISMLKQTRKEYGN